MATKQTNGPIYRTESVEDLREILDRAGNWAESVSENVIAAELREARDFAEQLESETNE